MFVKDPAKMTMKELIKNNPNGKPMKSSQNEVGGRGRRGWEEVERRG